MPDPVLRTLREAAGPDREPSRAARERALSRLGREMERRPGRRRPWRLAAAAVTALALAGAGYGVIHEEARPEAGLGCYAEASLEADTTIAPLDGRPAVAICAELWRDGVVFGAGRQEPPPLQACTGTGAIHVLPSADAGICAELGLVSRPNAGADAASRRFARLREALVPRFERECIAAEPGERIVRRALAAHGYAAWNVESRAGGCTSPAFDSARRTVTLVGE